MTLREFRVHAYLALNLSFISVILLIFLYSLTFSAEKNNHPIPSFYSRFTGRESPTAGLSKSFSEIIRGRWVTGRNWNENGIPLFSFFLIQLFLRLGSSVLVLKTKVSVFILARIDGFLSFLLFLYFFRHLIAFWHYF